MNNSKHVSVNGRDLQKLIFMLHGMGHEYRKLLEFYFSAESQESYLFMDMLYSGIDCARLKNGSRLFEISLPDSFGMESIGVNLSDSNDFPSNRIGYYTDLQFVATKHPEDMIISHCDYFIGEGEAVVESGRELAKLHMNDLLPKGMHIAQRLLISRSGASEWLDVLALIVGYYFSAAEGILRHRHVCPTLQGMGFDLKDILQIQGGGKISLFWEEYQKIYREFMIMLNELHRVVFLIRHSDKEIPKDTDDSQKLDLSKTITMKELVDDAKSFFNPQATDNWVSAALKEAGINHLDIYRSANQPMRYPIIPALGALLLKAKKR